MTRVVPEWMLRPDAVDPYGTYTALHPSTIMAGAAVRLSQTIQTNSGRPRWLLFQAVAVRRICHRLIPTGFQSSWESTLAWATRSYQAIRSMYMYGNKVSGNQTSSSTGPSQYMVVVATNHPIMQGIPLDAQGRVKIWRDPYPEENAHLPAVNPNISGSAPKLNYKYSWTFVNIVQSTLAAGTTVLGLEGDDTSRAVFAVNPAGGVLYNGETNHGNYVHFFVNEHGSGDSRRAFNA